MKTIISTESYGSVSIPIGESVIKENSTDNIYIQYQHIHSIL